jgi:multidrug resistance efflux pump
LSGCSKSDKTQGTPEDKPSTIRTEPVRAFSLRRNVDVVGSLAAQDQATISAEASGNVSRILADLGDRVVVGQVLVELDGEKLRYSAAEQNAALDRALAKYGASRPDRLPPIEQTPDVQKAAAELSQVKQAYDRATELYKRQLLPKQVRDDAEATYRAMQAAHESAMQNAQNLRADIAASVASAKLADRRLRDASIRAPFNGYVEKRLVSLGQLVNAQTPVMSIVRMDPLKVAAEIPEAMTPWVKVAQPLTLFVDAYPDRPFTATVSRISPSINPQTRVPSRRPCSEPGQPAQARRLRPSAP